MQLVAKNNPILHCICRPDFIISLTDLNAMFSILHGSDGLGLAAPQVGINARLFITYWDEVFVNPQVRLCGPLRVNQEGCLSLPETIVTLLRWDRVCLTDGRLFKGQKAAIIQHEINHLNGILITDPIHQGRD